MNNKTKEHLQNVYGVVPRFKRQRDTYSCLAHSLYNFLKLRGRPRPLSELKKVTGTKVGIGSYFEEIEVCLIRYGFTPDVRWTLNLKHLDRPLNNGKCVFLTYTFRGMRHTSLVIRSTPKHYYIVNDEPHETISRVSKSYIRENYLCISAVIA